MNLKDFLSSISFKYDNWDDYGYKQTAHLYFNGEFHYAINIEPNTQENYDRIINDQNIESTEKNKYFFWGDSKEYYQFILETLTSESDRNRWFELTGDIAYRGQDFINYYDALEERTWSEVLEDGSMDLEDKHMLGFFDSSFFRGRTKDSWQDLLHSFHRLTVNKSFLSDYKFIIKKGATEIFEVDVKPNDNISVKLEGNTLPIGISNNVFCLIGENGSGKTWFTRELSKSILKKESSISIENIEFDTQDDANIINKILYCSFSPFDEGFDIGLEEDEKKRFEYIGLLNYDGGDNTKKLGAKITEDIMSSLQSIKLSEDQSKLWLESMNRISFEAWASNLINLFKDELMETNEMKVGETTTSGFVYRNHDETFSKIQNLSSGQKIFLLTITKLVEKLTERTIVFIDEPELFLHPPMVKSYVRLISDIVSYVNGLAFIITHSPITIQEFPNNCVKIAERNYRGDYLIKPVEFKTFGENINVINDRLFNIGLQQSGYYRLIEQLKFVENGKDKLSKLKDISGSEARLLISLFLGE